jgi:hypothetical protein
MKRKGETLRSFGFGCKKGGFTCTNEELRERKKVRERK